ncbi:unnamed protein product, partial [Cuscuta europaea]
MRKLTKSTIIIGKRSFPLGEIVQNADSNNEDSNLGIADRIHTGPKRPRAVGTENEPNAIFPLDLNKSSSLCSNRAPLQNITNVPSRTLTIGKSFGGTTSLSYTPYPAETSRKRDMSEARTTFTSEQIELLDVGDVNGTYYEVDKNTEGDRCTEIPDTFSDDDGIAFDVEDASYAFNSYEDYLDLGDSTYTCEYCGSLFWHAERVKRHGKQKPKFSMCCNQGDVVLPKMQTPPQLLRALIFGTDERSGHFLKNIRSYNSMFSFTSMCGKTDGSINSGTSPPVFRLNGQNYHTIGSLLPKDGQRPKFLQMYLSDPAEEIAHRINAVRNEDDTSLQSSLVQDLKEMLDTYNVHAKSFRMARDRFNESNSTTLKMKLIGKRHSEGRTYNMPSVNEVAALIEGDFDVNKKERDVILQTK